LIEKQKNGGRLVKNTIFAKLIACPANVSVVFMITVSLKSLEPLLKRSLMQ
jgi:hypothetical protein